MALAVRTQDLSRAYDDEYALIGLNSTFESGTITAILGPNGAGKSTLLHLLTLMMRPTEGTIFFDDVEAKPNRESHRAKIGYVGHQTMLYRTRTGHENLMFFGRLYGLDNLASRVDELLAVVGLTDAAQRNVEEYSRGMAQRLTIARALLPKPTLLLLDEPFTGLDQQGHTLVEDLFKDQKDQGAITLLVSHDLSATARIADHCLVLKRGRLKYQGPVTGSLQSLYQTALQDGAAT